MTAEHPNTAGGNNPGPTPDGPLKSKLPVLCGSILISEICVVYFAGLTGIGLKPVSLPLLIAGVAVITVVLLAAAILLPRRIGQKRPGILLGWIGQALIVACGFVLPAMFFVGLVFAGLYAAAVYWGRRIDREVVEYFRTGGGETAG